MEGKEPMYYDIPDGLVWELLTENWLRLTDKIQKKHSDSYWEYNSRRIFNKSGIELTGGVINHLRISKSKWIEELDIDMIEKNELHKKMLHSYDTSLKWYI